MPEVLDASFAHVSETFVGPFGLLAYQADELRADPGDLAARVRYGTTYFLWIEGVLALSVMKITLSYCRNRGFLPGYYAGFAHAGRADHEDHGQPGRVPGQGGRVTTRKHRRAVPTSATVMDAGSGNDLVRAGYNALSRHYRGEQPRLLRSVGEWLRPGGWLLATTGRDAWVRTPIEPEGPTGWTGLR